MEKFIVYNQHGYPQIIEGAVEPNLDSKLKFAKQILITDNVSQVEFEHAGSRYTIEFDIQNTL